MLAGEALRLAAVEILCPTGAAETGNYPTLAGALVYDSVAAAVEDLDRTAPYTPVLSLYTTESGVRLRGENSAAWDTTADAALDIVVELAVVETGNAGSGENPQPDEFADAMAGNDPDARLVLAALCAQVRRLLEHSQKGGLWRRIVRRIVETEIKTFAYPELGLRWQRVMIRMHCEIRDDDFDMAAGGLPEPVKSLYESLPADSYAKAKLAVLAQHFPPEILPALSSIELTTGRIVSGPTFP